ncbi:AfsR/SARP family transcriptional regulator (plasmid) [Streptomyces sp. NBC_01591]|uniref:AfsR/SARP family transcriptional regulator n=1 Tax=Streptomyces sp. NBC_01591 TaxID=2975888 RepID=UPI002DD85392|nr:AfsR/SARP family transcriptional regulator [Streptomyces sp. NBC_01591]WSD74783.1 AfsR/SARP family transcriptional regulator [Streptomyces sp. NBC_01591]
MMLTFKLLGPLEILNGAHHCTPTAPRTLRTLALLVVRIHYVVPLSTIVEELWGDQPPRTASTTAQTYIYQLRRIVDEQGLPVSGKELLRTRAPGYVLHCPEERTDLLHFRRLTTRAQQLLAERQAEEASVLLRQALDLWRGAPLANVSVGPVLEGYLASLEEQRMWALNLRIEADLQLGRVHQLIEELRVLVVEFPYNEWYHSLLIFSLARVGRRRDALQAYERTRCVLSEELGLSPSAELRRVLQDAVLRDEDARPPRPMPSSIEPLSV